MTAAKGLRLFTPRYGWPLTTPAFLFHTIDANNDGVGFIFQSLSTDPITHIGFRYHARTGDPPPLTAGLQSVSTTTGLPTNTFLQNGGNDCKVSIDPPNSTAWDGLWQWAALDFAYTPAAIGEIIAGVILGGTTDAVNYSSITTGFDNVPPSRIFFPYASRLTAGVWSNSSGAADPSLFGWRTASGRFGNIAQSVYNTRTASTVGHRVAAKINVPAGWCSTYKVSGLRFTGSLSLASGKLPLLKIWNAGGALVSGAIDTEQLSVASSNTYYVSEFAFPSIVTLNAGTDYYFGFEVADAVNAGVIINGWSVDNAADLSEIDGGNCILSTYNGSVWTDDPLTRPWLELILDDITAPSGGSGSIVAPRLVIANPTSRRR